MRDITETEFRELYLSMSIKELAKKLKCSISTIHKYRQKLSIPLKGRKGFSGRKPCLKLGA